MNTNILECFLQSVERNPHRVAIETPGACFTVKEVDHLANRCAAELHARQIGAEDLVALLLDRSVEMIVAILGVMKAGAAWLPISVTDPPQRIHQLLHDSAVRTVVTIEKYREIFSLTGNVLTLDHSSTAASDPRDPNTTPAANSTLVPNTTPGPNHLAYAIYTSGSTGKPKAVLIEHHSLMNRISWMQQRYPIGPSDAILQKTPYTFDVSVWELLWWAHAGSRLCLLPPGMEKFPLAIIEAVRIHRITVIHFVPSMLNMFLGYLDGSGCAPQLTSLKICFCSGEPLRTAHASQFFRLLGIPNGTRLTNLYGPTETTIDVTYFDVDNPPPANIPIGLPITHIGATVVEKNRLAAPGEQGELWITGKGVARGYLNQVELTAERFPTTSLTGNQRAYRTGDQVIRLADGNIQYLGRIDHQVKIHGIRIELPEIEAVLNEYPGVKDCTVIVHHLAESISIIKAFYVSDALIRPVDLRSFLAARLPEYMVPREYVFLQKMPLTENGKTNRKQLLQLAERSL